jgi:integrase
MKDITTMRVESFINRRLKTTTCRVEVGEGGKKTPRQRSPTTVRKEVTLLSQIFNMAKAERLVAENPCDFIRKAVRKKIPARRKRERFLSVAEERSLIPRLTGRREHLLMAFRLALWTGMRRGEILRLSRGDLNFSDRTVSREVGGEKYDVPPGGCSSRRAKTGGRAQSRCAGGCARFCWPYATTPRAGSSYSRVRSGARRSRT